MWDRCKSVCQEHIQFIQSEVLLASGWGEIFFYHSFNQSIIKSVNKSIDQSVNGSVNPRYKLAPVQYRTFLIVARLVSSCGDLVQVKVYVSD